MTGYHLSNQKGQLYKSNSRLNYVVGSTGSPEGGTCANDKDLPISKEGGLLPELKVTFSTMAYREPFSRVCARAEDRPSRCHPEIRRI